MKIQTILENRNISERLMMDISKKKILCGICVAKDLLQIEQFHQEDVFKVS